MSSKNFFHSNNYLNINKARLEHLESLDLELNNKSVLELGAGIGDLSSFFINKGCNITITEGREENIKTLKNTIDPQHHIIQLDVENLSKLKIKVDIDFAYGILYHLSNPEKAIKDMSDKTSDMLLLETCVSFDDDPPINPINESLNDPTQAIHGIGCRPSRAWVFNELKKHFQYVYIPKTQPLHKHFITDFTNKAKYNDAENKRAVFIASRKDLKNNKLSNYLLDKYDSII